jgi:ribosomal protein L40E
LEVWMSTTCPNCGTRSPASADSCGNCGRGLYRIKHSASGATRTTRTTPAFSVGFPFGRVPLLITTSLVILGAGAATTVFGQGSDDAGQERTSQYESPAPVAMPSATSSPTPSPEPSTEPPRRTEPTQSHPGTPTAEPTRQPPIDEVPPEVRRMLEGDGITIGPDGDSVSMGGWYMHRDGTVRRSYDSP